MDEIDIKILRELTKDSRLSIREIARKVGLSANPVSTRIKNMEKQGIIKGYTTILDAEKLGYDVVAIIEVVISKGKLQEIEEKVAQNPNVCCVYDVTGASDAIVIARFKTRKELSDFVKSILAMEYVERTITHVVLKTVKEDFRIPL